MITEKSPFLKRSVDDVEEDKKYHFKVLGLIRKGRRLRAPYKQEVLAEGDVLIVRAPPDELVAIRDEPNLDLHPIKLFGDRIDPKVSQRKRRRRGGRSLFKPSWRRAQT